jgi:outer membrane protein assembly factor BamB
MNRRPLTGQMVTTGSYILCLVGFLISSSISIAQNWSIAFDGVGTFSSPRVTDLNGDGVGDVILGAGREEFQWCDSSVVALDGRNGRMLWRVKAIDQIFGSAALKDLNGDGVMDVVIGGRSAELKAINGATGKILWKFNKRKGAKKWYNFYNPQFINDQDGDGLEDILISNGGDVLAAPYDPNRPPGSLLVLSSRDGSLLAKAQMPDGKETYMSVAALPLPDSNDYLIAFGTGGETIGGNLFVCKLSDVLRGDLSGARHLDSSASKGYIGPPVWIDITGDGHHDLVANAVEGKLIAFDGVTFEPLWSVKVPNTEAYSSIAPGYFTGDGVPDFFVSYAIGVWPNLDWSKQIMVNGATGKIEYIDSLGYYQTSTPVVIDINNDGYEEAILSVNSHVYDEANRRTLQNLLVVIDFKTQTVTQLTERAVGANISSTPWIGDMDGDGLLDIVYCHGTNPRKSYTFDGMRISRVATDIPIRSPIRWGSYMGSRYDGIYPVTEPLQGKAAP